MISRMAIRGARIRDQAELPRCERSGMNDTCLTLFVKPQSLKSNKEGQDLVEYALPVCSITLVCVVGVNKVESAVNTVFANLSSSLA